MIKKIVSAILAAVCCLTLFSCLKTDGNTSETENITTGPSDNTPEIDDKPETITTNLRQATTRRMMKITTLKKSGMNSRRGIFLLHTMKAILIICRHMVI